MKESNRKLLLLDKPTGFSSNSPQGENGLIKSMNPSAISWLSQPSPLELYSSLQCRQNATGIFDSSILMNQCEFMDSFDEDYASVFGQEFQNYLSPANNSVLSSSTDSYSKFLTVHNMGILDFGNQNPSEIVQQANPMRLNPAEEVVLPEGTNNSNTEEAMPRVQPAKKKRIRPPSQTYDHIIAERRRREQLSQLFVALSALIPGLKKMDKSSILEDAIKYMRLLQERVKVLEEKTERKAMESVVLVKKSQIIIDDDDDGVTSDEQSSSFKEQPLPEIEARVCENQILLKVHCEKHKDALANLICKVESLNMAVVSTNATPFGDVTLDITIVAEMEKEFYLSMREVVTGLREALHPTS